MKDRLGKLQLCGPQTSEDNQLQTFFTTVLLRHYGEETLQSRLSEGRFTV